MHRKPAYLFDLSVRTVWIKMSRMYNQRANDHGITMSVGYILLHIDKEGTPSTQLGPKMGMEPTSLSRTLKTMEDKGLIRREEDKTDKRIVRIFLSEEGLNARYIARNVVFELNNKLAWKFTPEQIETFHDMMLTIDSVMDDEFYINSNL